MECRIGMQPAGGRVSQAGDDIGPGAIGPVMEGGDALRPGGAGRSGKTGHREERCKLPEDTHAETASAPAGSAIRKWVRTEAGDGLPICHRRGGPAENSRTAGTSKSGGERTRRAPAESYFSARSTVRRI